MIKQLVVISCQPKYPKTFWLKLVKYEDLLLFSLLSTHLKYLGTRSMIRQNNPLQDIDHRSWNSQRPLVKGFLEIQSASPHPHNDGSRVKFHKTSLKVHSKHRYVLVHL